MGCVVGIGFVCWLATAPPLRGPVGVAAEEPGKGGPFAFWPFILLLADTFDICYGDRKSFCDLQIAIWLGVFD